MSFHTLITPNSFKVTMQFMTSQLCDFSLSGFQSNLAMQEYSSEKFHVLLDKVTSPDTFTWIREASHIDFVHEKRHLDVTGQGDWRF